MLIKIIGIHDNREIPDISVFSAYAISIANIISDDGDPMISIRFNIPYGREYMTVKTESVKKHWIEIQAMIDRLRVENDILGDTNELVTTIIWNYKHQSILKISETFEKSVAEKTVDTNPDSTDTWSENECDEEESGVEGEECSATEFLSRHISEQDRARINDAIAQGIKAMNELGERLKEFVDTYNPTLK